MPPAIPRPRRAPFEHPGDWHDDKARFDASGKAASDPDYGAGLARFEEQAKLLDELVSPSRNRNSPVPASSPHWDGSAVHEYAHKLSSAQAQERLHDRMLDEAKERGIELDDVGEAGDFQSRRDYYSLQSDVREGLLWRDACLFDMSDDDGAPATFKLASFADVPFQGTGGWGLAIIPSRTKQEDAQMMRAKIELSRWFGLAGDVESVAIVRASKLALKRVGELEAAGIPVLFDFSGRADKAKGVVDPLEGRLSPQRHRRGRFKFDGVLTQEQAAVLGNKLDEVASAELLTAMAEEFGVSAISLSPKLVEAVTLGHERLEDDVASISGARPSRRQPQHWIQQILALDSSNFPTRDTEQLKQRLSDVSRIWVRTLRSFNLSPLVSSQRGTSRREEFVPDYGKFPEVADMFGISAKINAYYADVPVEDLLG